MHRRSYNLYSGYSSSGSLTGGTKGAAPERAGVLPDRGHAYDIKQRLNKLVVLRRVAPPRSRALTGRVFFFQRGLRIYGWLSFLTIHWKNIMQPYRTTTILAVLFLLTGLRSAYAQERTSPAHEASDLLRVEGTLSPAPNAAALSLALRVSTAGDDPVVRKRPGRKAYSHVTLTMAPGSPGTRAQDYNSSRSNNTNGQADGNGGSGTGATRRRSSASAPSATEVVLVSTEGRGRDEHSGRSTGVRQHGPRTSAPADAAPPRRYSASVDEGGVFVFERVPPGAYQVLVLADGHEFRGHVTVLK